MTTYAPPAICPRCNGRLFPDHAEHQRWCIACGFREPPAELLDVPTKPMKLDPVYVKHSSYVSPRELREMRAQMLAVIVARPGCNTRDISEALHISPKTMASRLTAMWTAGLIERAGKGHMADPYRWTKAEEA